MRNLLALVGAATLAFVGLGWYLGWYKLTRQPSTPGTQTIKVDLHASKIPTDVQSGLQKGAENVGTIIGYLRENDSAPDNDHASLPSAPQAGTPVPGTSVPTPRIQPVGATAPPR